jgi:hypothetical protein
MASRETSSTSSQSGVSYQAGSASAGVVQNIKLSRHNGLLIGGPYQGHSVEIYADKSVWDSTANKYLYRGVDYQRADLKRTG